MAQQLFSKTVNLFNIIYYLGPSYSSIWPIVMSLLVGVDMTLVGCLLVLAGERVVWGATVVTISVLFPVMQNSSSAKFSRNTFQS